MNKYRPTTEEKLNTLHVDNTAVREAQIASLKRLRAQRDPRAFESALNALTVAARAKASRERERPEAGNLLELAINAARAKATVGEMSMALEKVFGRYEALVQSVHGVYAAEIGGRGPIEKVRRMVETFEKAVFGPGTVIGEAAQNLLDRLAERLGISLATKT